MKLSMKVGIACYCVVCAIGLVMWARYWTATEFMPYHAVVSGAPWESLSPGIQRVVLGLLKGISAGFLATAVAVAVLVVPISRGEDWARWAVLAISAALLIPLVYLTVTMRLDTGAAAPVVPSVAALAINVVAFFAAGMGRREAAGHRGRGRDVEVGAR